MKKFVFAILLIVVFVQSVFAATAAKIEDDVFDLESCINIALINHPDLSSAKAQIGAAAAVTKQSASGLKPSLNISSTYNNSDGDGSSSAGVALSQLLFDGGKTSSRVKASELGRDSEVENFKRTKQTVAYDVKKAYFNLLQAQGDYKVAQESVEVYQEQLNKSRASYDAGTVPRSDVTAAEVDLGQAKLDQTRSRSAVGLARATLLNTMGIMSYPSRFSIKDVRDYSSFSLSYDEALAKARENRPDLRSKELSLKSYEETVTYQSKGLNPEVSTYGGYDWADGGGSDTSEWEIGLKLSVPLYDGGLTSARVEEARSNLSKAESEYDLLLQKVVLEVKTALLDIEEIRENIETTKLTVRQAQENLELATGRYRVGVGSPLEVSQAAEDYSQAKKDHNEALYSYMVSLAAMDKAMGVPVEDILRKAKRYD